MANKRSDLFYSTASTPRTASNSKYLHPEYCEEPNLNPSEGKFSKDRSYLSPGDTRVSGDVTLSSVPMSTQQSVNLKPSYFLSSPKRSEPDSLTFTQPKPDSKNEKSLTLRLEDKLKSLEISVPFRKSDVIHSQNMLELNLDQTVSARNELNDSQISFEGADDMKIPHLRWCAGCKAEVMTQVVYVNTEKTFWSSVGIFFSGGFLGCFLLPYMMNSCKGAKLVCHNCERVLL